MYHIIVILLIVKSQATIQLGQIQNTSWVLNWSNISSEYMNLSNTTYDQCLCRMFAMDNLTVSVAYQQNFKRCQLLFWNATAQLQTDETSIVYFRTIPLFLQTTTDQQPITTTISSKISTIVTTESITFSPVVTSVNNPSANITTVAKTTTTTITAVPIFLINTGGESGSLNPWIQSGNSSPILYTGKANGAYISVYNGSFAFNGGCGNETLHQTVSLTRMFSNAQLDSGLLFASVSFWEITWNLSSADTGAVALNFLSETNASILNVSTNPTNCISSWCRVTGNWSLPVGTRTINYIMQFVANIGNNADAWIDDNILIVA